MRVEGLLSYASAHARSSTLHGPEHWRRVASFGAQLVRETRGADLHVVALFSVLHSTQRYTDSRAPEHGRRAAELAEPFGRLSLGSQTGSSISSWGP